jgi:hypothetical protein
MNRIVVLLLGCVASRLTLALLTRRSARTEIDTPARIFLGGADFRRISGAGAP